jgi:2-iminobutanoate/2-iminopropanoate deaminase
MKRIISTPNAPAAIGPYSQAVEVNGTLYISGQLPVNPVSGKIEAATVAEQTVQSLKNIGAILEAAGYSYSDVVKSTVYLADMSFFAEMNAEYKKVYTSDFPARSAYAVKALPMNALVEIETIAAK